MNIPKIKDTVKEILELHPKSRDNEADLLFWVWRRQGLKQNHTIAQLYINLEDGTYATPESVTRARRTLQKEFPELRGNKYKARMEEQQRVKKDLGYKYL